MRVAFVIQKLAARSGGAERILVSTANELARRGHEVDILSHENRGVPPFYAPQNGVEHTNLFDRPIRGKAKRRWKRREAIRERLPFVFPFARLRWRMTHQGFIDRLREYIEARRPDVLVPFLPPAITPCAIAARGTDVRVVASTHNDPKRDYEDPLRWDPNPIDIKLRRQVLADVHRIVVLLPTYKEWYPRELHHKIVDIPNPVPPVDPATLIRAEREQLVVAVGRLAAVKRFDLLIRAWALLPPRLRDWRMEIYGHGPLRESLQALINELGLAGAVTLMGTTTQVSDLYLRASVLCHPAEYEGFPLAVAEALAHALPVIGFNECTGVNTIVQDGINGILLPSSGDGLVERLAGTLGEVLTHRELLGHLGASGPASVRGYAPGPVYDRWEATLGADPLEPEATLQ